MQRLDVSQCSSIKANHSLLEPCKSHLTSSKPTPKQDIVPPFSEKQIANSTVKAKYKEDIFKFHLTSSKLRDLLEEVTKSLKLKAGRFMVKYLNEDGEWILIACKTDLGNCIAAFAGGRWQVSQDVPQYIIVSGEGAELRGLNLEGSRRRGFSATEVKGQNLLKNFLKYGKGSLMKSPTVVVTSRQKKKQYVVEEEPDDAYCTALVADQETINCLLVKLLTSHGLKDRLKGELILQGGYNDYIDCTIEKCTHDCGGTLEWII